MGRQTFRQPERHGQPCQRTETGQHEKDRLPARGVDQQPAQHRRKNRRQAHHQHQLRKDFRRTHRIAFITDNRPRDHHPRAPAQRLNETCADQPFEVRRIGAGQGGGGEQADTGQQGNASPEAIRHRAVSQLTDGQAKEIRRQGQLNVFFIGAEGERHRREGRQIEIDRQRTESAQGAKNQNGTEIHQASSWTGVGSPTV